jgi:hypothetical protein
MGFVRRKHVLVVCVVFGVVGRVRGGLVGAHVSRYLALFWGAQGRSAIRAIARRKRATAGRDA